MVSWVSSTIFINRYLLVNHYFCIDFIVCQIKLFFNLIGQEHVKWLIIYEVLYYDVANYACNVTFLGSYGKYIILLFKYIRWKVLCEIHKTFMCLLFMPGMNMDAIRHIFDCKIWNYKCKWTYKLFKIEYNIYTIIYITVHAWYAYEKYFLRYFDFLFIEINKTNRSKGRNVLLITGNAMSL